MQKWTNQRAKRQKWIPGLDGPLILIRVEAFDGEDAHVGATGAANAALAPTE